MANDDQPLDREPQDTDDTSFDDAFDEYAGGVGSDSHDTDRDFDTGDQDDVTGGDQGDGCEQDSSGEQGDDDLTPREREMKDRLDRLAHSEASQRGRLGAYQRQINELQRQVQQQSGGQQPPANGQSQQQPSHDGQGDQSDDQQRKDMAESMGLGSWEEFKEDFPDMARALEARLDADRQKHAELEQRLAQYEPALQTIQQQAQDQHLKAQEDALSARHPEWKEVVAAPAFAEWLNQQPESLQGLVNSEDAAEAAALLDMYQAQTGASGNAESHNGTPDKRQQRLAAAQSPQRRGRPRQGQVADDFDAAFDHYAAKAAR